MTNPIKQDYETPVLQIHGKVTSITDTMSGLSGPPAETTTEVAVTTPFE